MKSRLKYSFSALCSGPGFTATDFCIGRDIAEFQGAPRYRLWWTSRSPNLPETKCLSEDGKPSTNRDPIANDNPKKISSQASHVERLPQGDACGEPSSALQRLDTF